MKKLKKVSKKSKRAGIEDDPLAGDMSEFIKNTKWQKSEIRFQA
jgi:hypothetical protein